MKHPIVSLALLLASSLATAVADPAPQAPPPSIAEVARQDSRFSTLLAAVKAADLAPALAGPGPLTVFAPTNEAFAALPEGVVAGLLMPERRGELLRVLTYHVLSGRVLAGDVLKVARAETLAGPSLAFGLTVGGANVIQADILCSNGVIHVIDRVLLPPEPTPMAALPTVPTPTKALVAVSAAIERGVPVYNAGDPSGCAAIYADTTRRLLATPGALGELHAYDLGEALGQTHEGPDAHAWALRRAFDRLLADGEFKPRLEAPLPAGFPGPGPVGYVVKKTYPAYRAARATGGERSFWTLFQHIQTSDVKMTAPVEMTLDDEMASTDMAFLYEHPAQGASGTQGRVAVLDLPAIDVLSIGLRGERSEGNMRVARRALEERLAKDGQSHRLPPLQQPDGAWRKRFWEPSSGASAEPRPGPFPGRARPRRIRTPPGSGRWCSLSRSVERAEVGGIEAAPDESAPRSGVARNGTPKATASPRPPRARPPPWARRSRRWRTNARGRRVEHWRDALAGSAS
jgi:uncharacterized surface protein with fasciclin (FAS1) repeats